MHQFGMPSVRAPDVHAKAIPAANTHAFAIYIEAPNREIEAIKADMVNTQVICQEILRRLPKPEDFPKPPTPPYQRASATQQQRYSPAIEHAVQPQFEPSIRRSPTVFQRTSPATLLAEPKP
ncbi:MAG: hypothetical protein AVDCRST_MAG95-495 [uncultured Adhaeribacter sp.]|uniref:Uncharacterized protein n=1 Tax=uncultured Adhaeribacter sp. TaxID=448109 RepID=A0A6J4HEG2_9BACT|nr:MAG: hypothetical protein AVDCRST_MAG95-495 [uncultured Adhaeribacter sp.]